MEENRTNLTFSSLSLDSLGFIIFVVFLILKLVGVIDWSWLYVTMPLWIPIGLNIVIFFIVFFIFLIIGAIQERKDRRNN